MAEHTPGPWHADISENGSFTITTPEGSVISSRNSWGHRAAESNANARLISAAPDLLESLKNLISLDERCGWHSKQADAAIAVIAKAEGRS